MADVVFSFSVVKKYYGSTETLSFLSLSLSLLSCCYFFFFLSPTTSTTLGYVTDDEALKVQYISEREREREYISCREGALLHGQSYFK